MKLILIINRPIKIINIWVVLVILLTTLALHPANAQKRVKLKQARELEGGTREGKRFDKVKGDVIFTQNETTIYCDSAYFFKSENQIEAFGNVRITEGDSVTVTGRKLEYDGNTKLAKLRTNVVFVKLATATLYTDNLDFSRPQNLAYYFDGGRLVDSINTLTSRKGYYNLNTDMASFKRNVHVKNPDYVMTADSLQYNSKTKILYFRTKTTVVNNAGDTFVYEGGEYDTKTRQSDLREGLGETPTYVIEGNDYRLDDIRKLYKIRGDVNMTYKEENLIIYGQAANYDKTTGVAKVFDNPWMAKITDNNDTLYMTADTLVSIDSPDPEKKRLLAYHNVKIFKKDLQGVADSLEYRSVDSTLYFYKDPVLWTEGNQMTADSISMLIKNNTINRIFLVKNSFVISQDTLRNFNQIKGRNMTAEFAESQINRVLVQGNGESLYFALDEEEQSFTGMNKIICSNIIIRFKEGKVNNLSFYVRPEAQFVPPHELTKELTTLQGFSWRKDERPQKEDVVKGEIEVAPQPRGEEIPDERL